MYETYGWHPHKDTADHAAAHYARRWRGAVPVVVECPGGWTVQARPADEIAPERFEFARWLWNALYWAVRDPFGRYKKHR